MGELENKVAVITGSAAGLGRECALLFAKEGASVVVADIHEARSRAVVEAIKASGGSAVAIFTDVSKEPDVEAVVQCALDTYGRLDVMHANAGIINRNMGTPLEDVSAEDWLQVLNINLSGVFYSIKHAARAMKGTGGGSIVVTSSASGLKAFKGVTIYGTTKGGVNNLVMGSAIDLGGYGIRVNAVCPLFGMSANFFDPANDEVVGKSAAELRPWDPDARPMPLRVERPPMLIDNAQAVLFLASDRSQYMSGVCLPTADGGLLGKVAI